MTEASKTTKPGPHLDQLRAIRSKISDLEDPIYELESMAQSLHLIKSSELLQEGDQRAFAHYAYSLDRIAKTLRDEVEEICGMLRGADRDAGIDRLARP